MEIPFMILGALVSLLNFYLVIERAVRDGINNSSKIRMEPKNHRGTRIHSMKSNR